MFEKLLNYFSSKKIASMQAELELAKVEIIDIKEKMRVSDCASIKKHKDLEFTMSVKHKELEEKLITSDKKHKELEEKLITSDKKHKELEERFTSSNIKVSQFDLIKLIEKYKLNDENGSLPFLTAFNKRLDSIIADTKTLSEIDEEAYVKRAIEIGSTLFNDIKKAISEI